MNDSRDSVSPFADCLALLVVLRLVVLGFVALLTAGTFLLGRPQLHPVQPERPRHEHGTAATHWYDDFPSETLTIQGSPEAPLHGEVRRLQR